MGQTQSDQVFLGHHKIDGVSSDKKRSQGGGGRCTVALKAWAHLAPFFERVKQSLSNKGKEKLNNYHSFFPCYLNALLRVHTKKIALAN